VIGGISGVCGGIIMMATISSAWSAKEMMRNIVKRERRGMRGNFKIHIAKCKWQNESRGARAAALSFLILQFAFFILQ
jgi:hypothetical protein